MSLDGLRVLVVEDDFFVARSLKVLLGALRCEVIGPVPTVDQARELIDEHRIDVALLDVQLSPGTSAAVARLLIDRGCPFVFVTGYTDAEVLPADLHDQPMLTKPVDGTTLAETLYAVAHGLDTPRPEGAG